MPGAPRPASPEGVRLFLGGKPLTDLMVTMDADHLQRFAGIGRLYGRAGMERLARSSFLVVGLGGVGSWTVEALARSGVGHLAMVDGDSVCVSNTNRQLHAVAGNDGKPKTEAMAERARAMGKGVVCIKSGKTELSRTAAASHTASLAGGGAASSAFLRQIGVAEVNTPSELIETLKIFHTHGPHIGPRLCSLCRSLSDCSDC